MELMMTVKLIIISLESKLIPSVAKDVNVCFEQIRNNS